jgi:phage protein D
MSDDRDMMAPAFAVYVEDTLVRSDVTTDIVEIDAERSLDMIDKIEITLLDANGWYADGKIFAEGNEIEVHFGYGNNLKFFARGEIVRHLSLFPSSSGVSTLRITAYDRSHRMARAEMWIDGGKSATPKKKAGKKDTGEVLKPTVGSIVTELLGRHGIVADVSPIVADYPEEFMRDPDRRKEYYRTNVNKLGSETRYSRKKGQTDLDVVRALANIYGCEFFVEYDISLREAAPAYRSTFANAGPGFWAGRFRPSRTELPGRKKYAFLYSTDPYTSMIMSCEFEFGLPEVVSELQAFVYDEKSRGWYVISEEMTQKGENPKFVVGRPGTAFHVPPGGSMPEIRGTTRIKIAASGYSIEVQTLPFRDAADAIAYVKKKMQEMRNAFVRCKGTLPGLEDIKPGQVHEIRGVGVRYSGDYYFSTIRNNWTAGGYLTEFEARKIIEDHD